MGLRVFAIAALCVLLVGLPIRSAFAERIGVIFSGHVSSAPAGPLLGAFSTLGTPFVGFFAFDPDVIISINDHGDYVLLTGPEILHLEAGGQSMATTFGFFSVYDRETQCCHPFDRWLLANNQLLPPYNIGVRIELNDTTRTRISSNDFFTPMTLDGFTSAEVLLYSYDFQTRSEQPVSTLTITTWTAFPAPEPGVAVLLGAALLAVGARNRSRED